MENCHLPIIKSPKKFIEDEKNGFLTIVELNDETGEMLKTPILKLKDAEGRKLKNFTIQKIVRGRYV